MTATRRKSAFGWAALVLWLGILLVTLFPYDFRLHNDVAWIEGGGLWFGKHGIVVSDGPSLAETAGDDSLCSIEMVLRPASFDTFSTILAVSRKDHPREFELRQDGDGLVVSHIWAGDTGRRRFSNRDVSHVFKLGQMTLVTLTSGSKGLTVYSDGRMLQQFPGYTLSRHALSGELTLGTDPVRMNPWSGELRALELYSQELTATQVADNYKIWSRTDGGRCEQPSGGAVLYAFQNGRGSQIDDLCGGGPTLTIPALFDLPLKPFLSPPWKEFSANWDYFNDALWNVIGFIPFGFALCGYLSLAGRARSAIWITVLSGGLTSLAIEILQGYLPHRGSGITDVITNTCGAVIGAYLVSWEPTCKYMSSNCPGAPSDRRIPTEHSTE